MSGYARSLLLRPSVAVFGCEWMRTKQFLLFVWAGDDAKRSGDFLAVPDADSKSPYYGQVVASVGSPRPEGCVALVIEVEKARYTKLTFEHTPPH